MIPIVLIDGPLRGSIRANVLKGGMLRLLVQWQPILTWSGYFEKAPRIILYQLTDNESAEARFVAWEDEGKLSYA